MRKRVRTKIKLINKIIILYSKFISCKIIFSFSYDSFDNNIAVLESKIIYFCLTPNFHECMALSSIVEFLSDIEYEVKFLMEIFSIFP